MQNKRFYEVGIVLKFGGTEKSKRSILRTVI